jgi:FtsP/CotA-like multicopper oxidase with cupredoxin domain
MTTATTRTAGHPPARPPGCDGPRPVLTRRRLLAGIAGAAGMTGAAAAAAWASGLFDPLAALVSPTDDLVDRVEADRARPGRSTVTATLHPRPVTLDLGGVRVPTWGYTETAPGPLIRARAGDLIRATVVNGLPAATSVHWHGVGLRNDMDGVPGVTQAPIPPGGRFTYAFTAPDPGTYFYHPHSGVQLDRALYGVLVIDDPNEPGRYDAEWIVVLDDWVDGTGRTPDQVLAGLRGTAGMPGGSMGTAAGIGMGGMATMTSALLGGAGDISYPYYLVNGRAAGAPARFAGRPRQRVRLRLINAAADNAFRIAVGGHRLTVTHTDGFPVAPAGTDALLLGMGERADMLLTLGDGAFPLVAAAEGKTGQAFAVVRSGAATAPAATIRPVELDRQVMTTGALHPAEAVTLPARGVDRVHRLELGGGMMSYRWTINRATFAESAPLPVRLGERVRLQFVNQTMMFHPMHVHGHTFAVTPTGARKDTIIVLPQHRVAVDLDASNPGQWVTHCHNAYHAETGMMITLGYQA